MKKSDLIWAICEIDDDLLRVTEEEPDMKKINTRPLRILLVAAIVGALLVGTALAYTVKNWDDLFVRSFNMEESDKEFMNDSLQDVYAQVTQDGMTFTVTQLMGSEHCMVVALEIKLPDDMELGTTSAEDLKAYMEEIGRPWGNLEDQGSVAKMLYKYFDYDPDQPDFPDAPFFDNIVLYPVHMEKTELLEKLDERYETSSISRDDNSEFGLFFLLGSILSDKARDELGDGYSDTSGGTIKRSYDPETRTLTALQFVEFSGSMQGMPYTLVIDHLYVQNMKDAFTPAALDGFKKEDVLSDPVVINFTADYQSQVKVYDISRDDGTLIGTFEISPMNAYAELFPGSYGYLEYGDEPCICMADGREIVLDSGKASFGGAIDDHQTFFYISEEIIDLSQVKEVRLGDYILTPQSGG